MSNLRYSYEEECDSCLKKFNYKISDIYEHLDFDYDENPFLEYYLICPYCNEKIVIDRR